MSHDDAEFEDQDVKPVGAQLQLRIVELTSIDEWTEAVPVLAALRPEATHDRIETMRAQWLKSGGLLLGLRENATLTSVAGLLVTPRLCRGLELWVSLLVTLPEHRSRGHGRLLLNDIEKRAAQKGCDRVILHSNMTRERAHHFYETCGFRRHGFVFVKDTEH